MPYFRCCYLIAFITLLTASQLIAQQSSAEDIPNRKAKALYKKGRKAMEGYYYVQSVVDFTDAIDRYPQFADAYYYRGISFFGLSNPAKGLEDFEKALEIDPTYFMAYWQIIEYNFKQENHVEVLPYLDRMEEHIPDQIGVANYKRAICFESLARKEEALAQYKLALGFYERIDDPKLQKTIQHCKDRIEAIEK